MAVAQGLDTQEYDMYMSSQYTFHTVLYPMTLTLTQKSLLLGRYHFAHFDYQLAK